MHRPDACQLLLVGAVGRKEQHTPVMLRLLPGQKRQALRIEVMEKSRCLGVAAEVITETPGQAIQRTDQGRRMGLDERRLLRADVEKMGEFASERLGHLISCMVEGSAICPRRSPTPDCIGANTNNRLFL